jgi:hypothetical protein
VGKFATYQYEHAEKERANVIHTDPKQPELHACWFTGYDFKGATAAALFWLYEEGTYLDSVQGTGA